MKIKFLFFVGLLLGSRLALQAQQEAVILTQPSQQVSYLGGTTQFEVLAGGDSPLYYQWQFNGTNLLGKTDASISIENLTFADAGNYSVIVSNEIGSTVSSNAALYVNNIAAFRPSETNFYFSYDPKVPPGLTNVIAAFPGSAPLALKADGTVATWLLEGNEYFSDLTNLPPNLTNVVAVQEAGDFCLALKGDGTIAAWGIDHDGVLDVPADLTNAVAVTTRNSLNAAALTTDGKVRLWGGGYSGDFPGLSNVVAISGSETHIAALKSDGSLVLADWISPDRNLLTLPITNIATFFAGADFRTYILGLDGKVYSVYPNDFPTGGFTVLAMSEATNFTAIASSPSEDSLLLYPWVWALKADGTTEWLFYDGTEQSVFPKLPVELHNVAQLAPHTVLPIAIIGEPNPHFISAPEVHSSQTVMKWRSIPNRRYRVQFTSDLNSANWTDAQPDIFARTTVTSATNQISGDLQRFYRVRLLP